MKKTTLLLTTGCILLGANFSQAASILRITEVMSSGDTKDWFEVTNFGDTAANLANYRVDDSTFSISTSLALSGVSSIAPGESVIFTEGTAGDFLQNVATLRANWSLPSSVQVGGYGGSGIGLNSDGDGLTLFNDISANGGAELPGPFAGLIRVSFGLATSGTSFQWTYDSTGGSLTAATLTTAGITGDNAGAALLGTPGSVPEPSALLLGGLGALGLFGFRRRA